jgi:hypothetical protein
MTQFFHEPDGTVRVLRDGYPVTHTAVFSPDQWQAVQEHVLFHAVRRVREENAHLLAPLVEDVTEVEDDDELAQFRRTIEGAQAFQAAADEAGYGRPQ